MQLDIVCGQYVGDDVDLSRRHPEEIGCGTREVVSTCELRDETSLVRNSEHSCLNHVTQPVDRVVGVYSGVTLVAATHP
jgi:hypothetical protein